MKYRSTFDGVGEIYKESDGWYWKTIYGDTGGPMKEREHAIGRMDTTWAVKSRQVAGVNKHASATTIRNLARLREEKLHRSWFEFMTKPWI